MNVYSPFLYGLQNTAANLWISTKERGTKNKLLVKIKKTDNNAMNYQKNSGEMVRREVM